jgi:hypothetical protein
MRAPDGTIVPCENAGLECMDGGLMWCTVMDR